MLKVQQALDIILNSSLSLGDEEVSLYDCFGRVLAEDIFADRDYPPFNRSAVDGFAIKREDLSKFTSFKLVGEIYAGMQGAPLTEAGTCVRIMTGAPASEGADAVIRVEDSEESSDGIKFKVSEVKPWCDIARQGEDVKSGNLILEKGKVITPAVASLIASVGKPEVRVKKFPTVTVIVTGDELVKPGKPVLPFQIRDSNTFSLLANLKKFELNEIHTLLAKDNIENLSAVINKGLSSDILILSGGVSMGKADFVPEVLQKAGVEEVFHKVEIKPGKPLWYGKGKNGQIVFALPGNPVSVLTSFKVFIEPFLRKSMGLPAYEKAKLPICFSKKKKTKFEEYFPCKLKREGEKMVLDILPFNGSGDMCGPANSDGLAIHPANIEELKVGDELEFIEW